MSPQTTSLSVARVTQGVPAMLPRRPAASSFASFQSSVMAGSYASSMQEAFLQDLQQEMARVGSECLPTNPHMQSDDTGSKGQ